MNRYEKDFLSKNSVKSPLELPDSLFLEYLRLFVGAWGFDVVMVARQGNPSEKELAIKLAREAVATGAKVHVWRRRDGDAYAGGNAPGEFKVSLV